MNTTIQSIEALKAELKNLQPLKLEYQQQLDKKLRLEFNYNSNHLEGNTLTYSETELLLMFDKATGKHELRELEEMKAHDVAYELIKEWAADVERPLNETVLKNLNEILLVRPFWKDAIMPDGQSTRRLIKVGDYKEFPNSVRLQNGGIFHYASPEETPIQMGDLIQWYRDEEENRKLHPVELAALLHYKFVRIHPFDDGNGRISRLLMNYVLLRNQFPPIIIKSAEKKDYLFALNQADAGDLDAFTNYITKRLLWSLELSIKAAKGETLEEEDDLEKEIIIWKRSLINEPDTIPKNNVLIFERYNDSIRPLFELFIEKHKQFSDLFFSIAIVTYSDEKEAGLDLAYLDNAIKNFETRHKTWIESEDDEVFIEEFSIYFIFTKFKKSGINAFDYKTFLECRFSELEWSVSNGKDWIRKFYSQALTKNELKDFVRDTVKKTFEDIQSKASVTNAVKSPGL